LEISFKINECLKNGIKAYPVFIKYGRAKIQVEINGVKKPPFDKVFRSYKEINEAMATTYEFYYNKLKK